MTAAPDPSLALTWMRQLARVHGVGARELLEGILVRMSPAELAALAYHWPTWRRTKQVMPEGAWRVLLLLAGRSWGKTRAINEWLQGEIIEGRIQRAMLIGRTDAEAMRVFVKHKHSGLEVIAPPWFKPRVYVGELPRIVWPNGATAYLVSADAPDSVRGDDLDAVVWDEVAAADPTKASEVFYNSRMALRGRDRARLVMATTSKRRRPIMREIRDKAREDPERYRVVIGGTLENRANLPHDFIDDLVREYAGSPLWAQELEGAILDDEPEQGALWNPKWFRRVGAAPDLSCVVIGVDPAISTRSGSDLTGIVAAGAAGGRAYVLADQSGRYTADKWPAAVWQLAYDLRAAKVVVETNRGGNLVTEALARARTDAAEMLGRSQLLDVPIVAVHVDSSKETRADPVSAFYERGLVWHVGLDGRLDELEQEMLGWDPKKRKSPDRIDAAVHALWDLRSELRAAEPELPAPRDAQPHDFYEAASFGINPYAAHDQLMGRGR